MKWPCAQGLFQRRMYGAGGRTWQNYCQTLGLVEFRRAEGPASMRNQVTEGVDVRGGRGQRTVRA